MNLFLRDRVAAAVHQAVTEVTGDDGARHCDLYALGGVVLLNHLTGKNYQIQVGSLFYLVDPRGNGWLHIDATNCGMERLEYHAWIGLAGKPVYEDGDFKKCEICELIDLSTRHMKALAGDCLKIKNATKIGDQIFLEPASESERVHWTKPDDPPLYVWSQESPDDFRYIPDFDSMKLYYDMLEEDRSLVYEMGRLSVRNYKRL